MNPKELLPQVYDELRKVAAGKLAMERADHTLNATALVHEVYMKLGSDRSFHSKSDYLQAAAQAMRRILVDHARKRNAVKRDGGQRVDLASDMLGTVSMTDEQIESLDDCLEKLAAKQPKIAELVQLRYFAGCTIPEAAEVLHVSPRTADTWWAYAKAWLTTEILSS